MNHKPIRSAKRHINSFYSLYKPSESTNIATVQLTADSMHINDKVWVITKQKRFDKFGVPTFGSELICREGTVVGIDIKCSTVRDKQVLWTAQVLVHDTCFGDYIALGMRGNLFLSEQDAQSVFYDYKRRGIRITNECVYYADTKTPIEG